MLKKLGFILLTTLFFNGCSPFGDQSLIQPISNVVDNFLGKSSGSVVSGGSETLQTNPGVPSQNYKVTVVVGGQMAEPFVTTAGGYKVYNMDSE